MERKVVAFQNTNNYPVSFNILGIRGKVTLWEGQQIRDREGIPLIPPNSEWAWLISKGVKPVYIEEGVEVRPALPAVAEAPPEIILDDVKLMEQKAATETQNLVAEFLAPKQIVPEEIRAAEESAAGPPVNYLERPDNPDPNKGALVWQDKDGVWILNKDGFASINPAEIKKHVRRDKTLGKDFLDILEWRTFGSKPAPETEEESKSAEEAMKIIEDNFQV
jgi:hypothetical protein